MAPPKKGDLSATEQKILDLISKGSVDEVKMLLKEPGVRVDCLDNTGMTPLQHAAFRARKDLCELFLSHGANVNSMDHENGYSTLMFAALSGKTDVTRLILEHGVDVSHVNSVNRTASQMAAFVGQHDVACVINNFFPREELDYYTKIQGFETEPKLPPKLSPVLHRMINRPNLHPVGVALYLKENPGLLDESYKVAKVLDLLCEKNMKSRDTNDVLALKSHYLATIVRLAANQDKLDTWIKSLLRGREEDGCSEVQERLIRQALKDFPYPESHLLQQLVRNIAPVKIGDEPRAITMLNSGINGQQFVNQEHMACDTCGLLNADKKCSVCKMVNYCSQTCQKLHWFTHKKLCNALSVVHVLREREKAKEEEKRKEEELAKKEKKELEEKTKQEDVKEKNDTDAEHESTDKEAKHEISESKKMTNGETIESESAVQDSDQSCDTTNQNDQGN